MSPHDPWNLRGIPPPPHAERRALPGEPQTPEQAALHLLDSHAAAIFALTVRSRADFRLLPVLPAGRCAELAAALLADGTVPPSLLESLAPLLTPRLLRLRHHLRRRLGRVRVEVPLAAVREMDPVCLRQNTRRPGRTLVEKAGAKQTLRAVVRVERFDTMENRVLVAACRTITRHVSERLATLSAEQRAHPRARSLRRVADAAAALLALPELAKVTLPRPGERPSYALLKDPDYRAVYRALRLLRAEEERFVEEWISLPQVWNELLLLIVWALMDAALPDAAVPSWSRLLDRRTSESRLVGSPSRRWLHMEPDCIEEWQVAPSALGVCVHHRLWADSDSVEEALTINWPLGTVPADRRISRHIEQQLAALGVPGRTKNVPVDGERHRASGDVALSALNPWVLTHGDDRSTVVATTAAALLPTEPGERELQVLGRSAAFLRAGMLGPHALHRDHAAQLGRLLLHHVRPDQEPQRLAIVIPDRMSEPAQRALRQTLGPCWAVWHTVALALAYVSQSPAAAIASPPQSERRLLVLGVSAASCDLSVIGVAGQDADSRLLIRRPQLSVSLPGIESLLLDAVPGDKRDAVLAAWLRSPDSAQPWVEQPTDPPSFCRHALPDVHAELHKQLATAAARLLRKAGSVELAIVAGIPATMAADLQCSLPVGAVVNLEEGAAVVGARQFLLRHRAGRPTWEDELLPLAARVLEQEQRRHRRDVELIPAGKRVRPGERLTFPSQDTFTIPPDTPTFDVPLFQGDGGATAFHLHYQGRPLPLRRPASVQIVIDFRYGFDGLRGELRASGPASFARIPFELTSSTDADAVAAPAAVHVPQYTPPISPADAQVQEIRMSLADARGFLKDLPAKQRREAKKNPSLLAKELRPRIRGIDEALKGLTGSGPDSMPAALRSLLSEEVGPFLEWLAGWARSWDKEGDPPALAEPEEQRVFNARAGMRIRRTRNGDQFADVLGKRLRERQRSEDVLRAIGKVIDGTPDALWDCLIAFETGDKPEHFRAQAWGLRRALIAHPGLALALSAEQAERTLQVLLDGLRSLPAEDPKFRSHFAIALQAIPHLCRVRQAGHLMPTSPVVQTSLVRLGELRPRLPKETLSHAEGGRTQDEPLSQAIDALEGREVRLIFVEKDAT